MAYPDSLNKLIEMFKKMPGVGLKTAERYAFHVIDKMDKDIVEVFGNTLIEAKTTIRKCKLCNNITDNETCSICLDPTRNKDMICIVDDVKYINVIDKMGRYKGLYFVLSNLISPSSNIFPEDTNINELITKVKNNNYKEIIIALKPSIDSEITAGYIKKMLSEKEVVVSKIAQGIPHGVDMSYIDDFTLLRAFEDRNIVS